MKKIKLVDENLIGQPGLCPDIDPKTGWERETDTYDCILYTDKLCYSDNVSPEENNYAWIIEPPIINGENYRDIPTIASKFNRVFSHHLPLENKIENFVYVPHGGTWLSDTELDEYSVENLIAEKTKEVSCIFSDKMWNAYHRMRHRVYEEHKGSIVEFFGSGTGTRLNRKIEGLKEYRYSIVVENSEERGYFTEKLIDCFLTGTVPIYLGCPNIEDYFCKDGIIVIRDVREIKEILTTLSASDYSSRSKYIKENYNTALNKYIHPEHIIQWNIEKDVQ